MNKEVLFTMNTGFRDDYTLKAFRFGKGEKAACIVGAMRGNEYQQLYICAKLIEQLKELEQKGAIVAENEILVIPSINSNSMNVGKRFWVTDNSDINRQFPGNKEGEATSRAAAAVMEAVKGYSYGLQFASFYLEGEFIPHIRMMETGYESRSLANLFGLPYVITGKSRAFDKTTLNYNWQLSGTSAFSLYTGATDRINEKQAQEAVASVLRFLMRMGIIRYHCHNGYIASVLDETELVSVHSERAGFLVRKKEINDEVKRGDVLAEIIDPYDCSVRAKILAPVDGIIFFTQTSPMVYQNSSIFKIIKKLHR